MFARTLGPWRCAVLAFLLLPTLLPGQTPTRTESLVEINTTAGRIVVALYNETPKHRDNFLKLVRQHFYDSLLFHRVVPDFMVQGGDPDSRKAAPGAPLGNGGPGYTLPEELHPSLIHTAGALAAARTDDAQETSKTSSGSQFYIVLGRSWMADDLASWLDRRRAKDPAHTYSYTQEQFNDYVKLGGTPHLDGDYTVFGHVVEGLDVLDQLAKVPCNTADRPLQDVRMWMRVIE